MSMADIGVLERTSRARYRLGWRLLSLTRTLMQTCDYREPISRVLDETVKRYGETMHLAVFERGSVVYLDRVVGRRSSPLPTRTGVRLPAHPSAVGKVLLAHCEGDLAERYLRQAERQRFTKHTIVSTSGLLGELDRIRRAGHGFDHEETIEGVCCAAAPVRAAGEGVVAAISVTVPRDRFCRDDDTYVRLVEDAAGRASKAVSASCLAA
jgi:DNA-binding IclR family transcriptional regulator